MTISIKTVRIAHRYAVRYFDKPYPDIRCEICLGGKNTITKSISFQKVNYAKGTKRINYTMWNEYLFMCDGCADKYGMLSEDKPTLKKGLSLLKMKGY